MFNKIWEFIKHTNHFDPITKFSKLFWKSPLLTAIAVGGILVSGWWLMGRYSVGIDPVPTAEEICARFYVKRCPANIEIVHYTDPAEYPFALFLWGIFSPVIWWYYLSVYGIWNRLLQSLSREGLVDKDEFRNAFQPFLGGSFWLPSLLISIFVMVLYAINSIPSELALGRASFWTLSFQGAALIILFVGVNAFVLISFALRTLILIIVTARFFNTRGIKDIHAFHMDRCGGFGAVATFATQLSSLAVFIGFWAVWYSMLTVMSGGEMNFGMTVILLYSAYGILVPLLLIVLTHPVSMAMKRYKRELLAQVSKLMQRELDELVKEAISENVDELLKKTTEGEKRYQSLQQLYEKLSLLPESPIRLANLKQFTSFAISPAVLGFISTLLSMFDLADKIRTALNV